ncbi:MAG: LuxR C-terminal-related transcriptional regulator [Pseudomonadota bacterium]
MLSKKLITKKIENFKWELGQDYLAFFYNPALKKQHLHEIIHLIHYRYFKEFYFLTEKERQCLYLAGQGKTITETAHILNIRFDTAREYREKSIKKMDSKNITEAAVKYYDQKK